MEGDLNLKPTAGVSSESGEKNSLVKSPGKTEPRLFVGLCPDHSGYRLCWCATCKAWLCRECIVADHPNDVCEVISLSQAVSMFQREDQGAMAQLKLRRIQTLSLVRKGDELKAAVQRLLKLHEELMDDLRKEQESLDAFTESSTKRTANLESISQYLNEDFEKTGDSLDIVAHTREDDVLQYRRTLEGWQQDQREWVDQLAKCLDATHNIKIKKIHSSISALQKSGLMAVTNPATLHMTPIRNRLSEKTLTVESLKGVLAEDSYMLARSLILQLNSGTFSVRDVCRALGEGNVKCVEHTFNNIYIITTKDTAARDHIASTFKSMNFKVPHTKQSGFSHPAVNASYTLYPVAPIPARVQGILLGIPTFLSSRNLEGLQGAVSYTFPLLSKVELQPRAWINTNIHSGAMTLRSVTDDLLALDNVFKTKAREVPFESFTGKLTELKAEPLDKECVLPEEPFAEGFSFEKWSW
ncbi:uncharacterized protein LOC122244648 [Penaeus japonicus]|uniref:uncharacterized protein LOC122244648 n=1 Tax=Penaeus japonicus TaxID=27405 RepID=UPI001C70B7D3|nr:uncharacterized protein LOC122244648 [Penaeus japonicus]XP_042858545.1 uncharacterized protein LOC122244648 [Penaeus japonicus]